MTDLIDLAIYNFGVVRGLRTTDCLSASNVSGAALFFTIILQSASEEIRALYDEWKESHLGNWSGLDNLSMPKVAFTVFQSR